MPEFRLPPKGNRTYRPCNAVNSFRNEKRRLAIQGLKIVPDFWLCIGRKRDTLQSIPSFQVYRPLTIC